MRKLFTWALFFLAIAATIGALLRLIYVVELPWLHFRAWLHAHSHVAMLGWLFTGIFIALLDQDRRSLPTRTESWLFVAALVAVGGMLIAFPIQGYGTWSIAFSVLHMLLGYGLVRIAWSNTMHWPAAGSRLLARIALIMLVASTIGIWAMAPIMMSGMAGSEIYYWTIQYFLHFQFNGWMWFGTMAIASRWAELHGVPVRIDRFTTALWLASAILTFALVIAWSERFLSVVAVNSLGVLLQFWAAWRTLMAMRRARPQARVKTTRWMRVCIGMLLLAMGVKVTIQTAVAWPAMADMAMTIRNYVVGFIHLNTLGAFTSLLFAHALMRRWFDERRLSVRIGLVLFFSGVLLSELLLFLQGTLLWAGQGLMPGFYVTLFCASVLLPAGVLTLLAGMFLGRAPGRVAGT